MIKIFKCPVCGKKLENPPYYDGWCSDECFHKNFWKNALDDDAIIIDGHCYHIEKEPADLLNYEGYLGYAGREFKIKMNNSDKIIITHNLWHQGEIPKKFNKQDNAQFVKV